MHNFCLKNPYLKINTKKLTLKNKIIFSLLSSIRVLPSLNDLTRKAKRNWIYNIWKIENKFKFFLKFREKCFNFINTIFLLFNFLYSLEFCLSQTRLKNWLSERWGLLNFRSKSNLDYSTPADKLHLEFVLNTEKFHL